MNTERTPEQIANPHIDQIKKEARHKYPRYYFTKEAPIYWAANRQRELDQAEVYELKRQVEENKTTIDLQRQGLLKLQGEIAAKEKEVEELKKEKPGKWAVVNKFEIFDSKEQADKFYEGSDALDNLIKVKIIQP